MQKISFNQDWRFSYGDPLLSRWYPADYSSFRKLDLPHDWSIELERKPDSPSKNLGGYFPMGFGWYFKTFEAPQEWQGKLVYIFFEGIFMNSEVWVNDHSLGIHPFGYTSFYYNVTPFLTPGCNNEIKVAVDNSHPLNSRWYSGSGIYRPVWLMVFNKYHINPWGVYVTTQNISQESATVVIKTKIENNAEQDTRVTLRSRLISPDHKLVGTIETMTTIPAGDEPEISQEILVLDPLLWSPNSPHLYRLESEIVSNGEIIDEMSTPFGIRSIDFSADRGFLLNGQPTKLKGGCVHHDNGILGAASYPRSEERKVELHKASGFNAIRCAHNPPAPSFLDACDRLGMLVIDEAFDIWREGKNPGDYHMYFEDWWERDLDSMLYRDRNHPSIILWSIGNELVERAKPEGAALARKLTDHVHQVDPTRPVTAAMCDMGANIPWTQADPFLNALDVGGYNYRWKEYLTDHERYPQRMIVGTESTPQEAFDHWMLVEENSYILGDFVWTSLDYLGESGIGRVYFEGEPQSFLPDYPWHQANCGDLDLCGFKRPQSYYRDILWESGEKLYIAVHSPVPEGKTPKISYWGWPEVWPNWNWAGRDRQVFKVDVYSTCEKVELFLNEQSLGIKPTTHQERFMALFEVPYEPGVIKAAGYSNNELVVTCELTTVGTPECIHLSTDRSILQAGEVDLSYITVEICDSLGQIHPSAENNIFFTAQGPGNIVAVGNANPVSTEPYIGNQRKAFRGRCIVVIKSNGEVGDIILNAQADGLVGAELKVQVK